MVRRLASVACLLALGACASNGSRPAANARPATTTVPNVTVQLVLPNVAMTPGVVSPKSYTIQQVCSGVHDQRPPQSVTSALKQRQLTDPALGYANRPPWSTDKNPIHYEEDHLIPLGELGGSGSDPANLWPEPGPNVGTSSAVFVNNVKDGLEAWMHHQVCAGKMTLAAAQLSLATDWVSAWNAAGRPRSMNSFPYYAGGLP